MIEENGSFYAAHCYAVWHDPFSLQKRKKMNSFSLTERILKFPLGGLECGISLSRENINLWSAEDSC